MTKRWQAVAPWAFAAALALTNMLLIGQNLRLRREVARHQPPPSLKAGDTVPSFTGVGLSGENVAVSYTGGGPKKVLFFFSPTCPYCKRQFPYWKAILERARDNNFEVLGLVSQTEDAAKVKEFLRGMGCADDSDNPLHVALVPDSTISDYRLSATPITLIVSSDGKVERVWNGLWSKDELPNVYTVFGLGKPS